MPIFGQKKKQEPPTPEVVWATEFLRSRLLKRAEAEGTPLTELELRYLQNCHLEGKAWQALDDEFEKHENQVDFAMRMSAILRRAYEEEKGSNPGISAEYLKAVNLLEDYWPEFELWGIAVPALGKEGPKAKTTWWSVAIILVIFWIIWHMATHPR